MKYLLGMMLILPMATAASGDVIIPRGGIQQDTIVGLANALSLSGSWASAGPLVAESAGTASHVVFGSSGTIADTVNGNTWTQQGGGVTAITSSNTPFAGNTTYGGAGPFTAAKYFTFNNSNPSDTLDFSGDFYVVVVFKAYAPTSDVIFGNSNGSTQGYRIRVTAAAVLGEFFSAGPTTTTVTGPAPQAYGVNIVSMWRIGTNVSIKVNLATTVTGGGGTITPGTAAIATIGADDGGTNPATQLEAYQMLAAGATTSETNQANLQMAFLKHQASETLQYLTVSRSAAATYVVNGKMNTAPPGVLRIDPRGLIIEKAKTNYALYSEAIDNAAWTNTGTNTVTADGALDADGIRTTMDLLDSTSGSNTSIMTQTLTVPASTGPWTASAYFRPFGASNVGSIAVVCPGGTTLFNCFCNRDRNQAGCSKASVGQACVAYATISALTRLSAEAACINAGNITNPAIAIHGGQYNTSTDKLYVGDIQFEATGGTAYIPTAGTTVARTAEDVSIVPSTGIALGGSWSMSFDLTLNNKGSDGSGQFFLLYNSSGDRIGADLNGSSYRCLTTVTGGTNTNAPGSVADNTLFHGKCSYAAGVQSACKDGSCTNASVTPTFSAIYNALYLGEQNGTVGTMVGGIRTACISTDGSGCQ